MSKVIKSGEIQSIQVGGKTVRGFSVGMYLQAIAVNTALSNLDYNLIIILSYNIIIILSIT